MSRGMSEFCHPAMSMGGVLRYGFEGSFSGIKEGGGKGRGEQNATHSFLKTKT